MKKQVSTVVMISLLVALGHLGESPLQAQASEGISSAKLEKESRVTLEDVPVTVLNQAAQLGISFDKKWFREVSDGGISYELKTKINGDCHSIEFDQDGYLEDVEILTKRSALPSAHEQNLRRSLVEKYQKYRITRVQKQWSGEVADLAVSLEQGIPAGAVVLLYEIELIAKVGAEKSPMEVLISPDGEILRERPIQVSNTDILDY